MIRCLIVLAAGLGLTACEAEPPQAFDPVALLVGNYSNAAQYAAADESLKIKPEIGDTRAWIDLQYASFQVVDVPAVPGVVIGLEWRKDAPDGDISRQRFWAFNMKESPGLMYFYGFKKPVDMRSPEALRALTMDDLISYGDACALPVVGIQGGYQLSIPETCRITTQTGLDMVLSATIKQTGDTLTYEESGRIATTGKQIFEVPGQMAYVFQRAD